MSERQGVSSTAEESNDLAMPQTEMSQWQQIHARHIISRSLAMHCCIKCKFYTLQTVSGFFGSKFGRLTQISEKREENEKQFNSTKRWRWPEQFHNYASHLGSLHGSPLPLLLNGRLIEVQSHPTSCNTICISCSVPSKWKETNYQLAC